MCNKQETALQQLRNTFYSNNQGSKVPTSRLAATKPSRAAAVGVAALSVEKRVPHHGQVLEIKKPNVGDIKKIV
jgi:hypothetical protein